MGGGGGGNIKDMKLHEVTKDIRIHTCWYRGQYKLYPHYRFYKKPYMA